MYDRWSKTSDLDVSDHLQTLGKTIFFLIGQKVVFLHTMCCQCFENLCVGCFRVVAKFDLCDPNI